MRVYVNANPRPSLALRYSYGFPAFTVTFQAKEHRDESEKSGLNGLFVQAIADLCVNEGTRRSPFEAQRAVYFTYAGWLEEQLVLHPELFVPHRGNVSK